MPVLQFEWKRSWKAWLGWSLALSMIMVAYLVIYPQMAGEGDSISTMFSNMGGFSKAFGLDAIDYGSFEGYFAIESANVTGLGASLYAAIQAMSMTNSQEDEFLLTSPLSRTALYLKKYGILLLFLAGLNAVVWGFTLAGCVYIGELFTDNMLLLMAGCLTAQVLVATFCYALSPFFKEASPFAGIGLALLLYFANMLSKLTETLKWLSWISPFSCCDAAWILEHGKLDWKLCLVQMAVTMVFLVMGLVRYRQKDF